MEDVKDYLDKEYLKSQRKEVTKLKFNDKNLTGALTLDLNDFTNLEKLDCSDNKISKINFIFIRKGITRAAKKQKLEQKLKKINLSNNKFEQDLSFLAELTELEELNLSNNKFFGSLEPLKNMTKLRKLDISGTGVDSDLEHLPESLREIRCFSGMRENAKIKEVDEVVVPLFEAVKENNIERIKEIIKAKKLNNLNFYDEHGNTLLHYATQKDNLSLLKFLVRNKGNVNAVNNYGWSVLHHASLSIVNNEGEWNIIELLLENGADTDAKTESGLTARDIFFQKDYSYIEQYDNLVDRVAQQTQILIK